LIKQIKKDRQDLLEQLEQLEQDDAKLERKAEEIRQLVAGICGRWKRHHNGAFPDADHIARLVELSETRKVEGDNASCDMCKRLESDFPIIGRTTSKGSISATSTKFRVQRHYPTQRKFLCGAYYLFFEEHGRVRTPEEVQYLLTCAKLHKDRKASISISCER
jgi:hypothetical protein